jgi:mRNA-degrading endonuclease toxin of MazEF toxin-antitoxin module
MFGAVGGGGRATEFALGHDDGLRVESVANLDSVQLVARSRLVRRVDRLRAPRR